MGRAADRIKRRPQVVFREHMLIGSTDERCGLFRRDFTAEDCEGFDREWYSFRKVAKAPVEGGELSRTERLMRGARWKNDDATEAPIDAMVLAGQYVYCAMETGKLVVFSITDGRQVGLQNINPVVWDGLAVARGCLFASTKAGEIICLGETRASDP